MPGKHIYCIDPIIEDGVAVSFPYFDAYFDLIGSYPQYDDSDDGKYYNARLQKTLAYNAKKNVAVPRAAIEARSSSSSSRVEWVEKEGEPEIVLPKKTKRCNRKAVAVFTPDRNPVDPPRIKRRKLADCRSVEERFIYPEDLE